MQSKAKDVMEKLTKDLCTKSGEGWQGIWVEDGGVVVVYLSEESKLEIPEEMDGVEITIERGLPFEAQ